MNRAEHAQLTGQQRSPARSLQESACARLSPQHSQVANYWQALRGRDPYVSVVASLPKLEGWIEYELTRVDNVPHLNLSICEVRAITEPNCKAARPHTA